MTNKIRGKLLYSAIHKRDVYFPWSEFFLNASAVSGMSGSVAVSNLSGSLAYLRLTNTAATCPLWATRPVPEDCALASGQSASGTLYIDWIDHGNADAVAAIAACVYAVADNDPVGSASNLATISTCVTGGNAASDINLTASLAEINAPASRDAAVMVKFYHDSGDGDDTSSACFGLIGFRWRYVTDRPGTT